MGEELLCEGRELRRKEQRRVEEVESLPKEGLCLLHVTDEDHITDLAVDLLVEKAIVKLETVVREEVVAEAFSFLVLLCS